MKKKKSPILFSAMPKQRTNPQRRINKDPLTTSSSCTCSRWGKEIWATVIRRMKISCFTVDPRHIILSFFFFSIEMKHPLVNAILLDLGFFWVFLMLWAFISILYQKLNSYANNLILSSVLLRNIIANSDRLSLCSTSVGFSNTCFCCLLFNLLYLLISVFLLQPAISLHVSVLLFFDRKYPSPTQFLILFASFVSLRRRPCCSQGQVSILQVEPAQKETDLSLPATNYCDSPYTEAIQGEGPASINPFGLCKQRVGP